MDNPTDDIYIFFKPFKTLAVRALSDISDKALLHARVLNSTYTHFIPNQLGTLRHWSPEKQAVTSVLVTEYFLVG